MSTSNMQVCDLVKDFFGLKQVLGKIGAMDWKSVSGFRKVYDLVRDLELDFFVGANKFDIMEFGLN